MGPMTALSHLIVGLVASPGKSEKQHRKVGKLIRKIRLDPAFAQKCLPLEAKLLTGSEREARVAQAFTKVFGCLIQKNDQCAVFLDRLKILSHAQAEDGPLLENLLVLVEDKLERNSNSKILQEIKDRLEQLLDTCENVAPSDRRELTVDFKAAAIFADKQMRRSAASTHLAMSEVAASDYFQDDPDKKFQGPFALTLPFKMNRNAVRVIDQTGEEFEVPCRDGKFFVPGSEKGLNFDQLVEYILNRGV